MKKVTIKNLIDFRNKNDRSKITYVNNLKKEKDKSEPSSGGDYWISSLSAIRNTFRKNNKELLDHKIVELNEKIKLTNSKRIKDQYHRNIDILINFKDYDLEYLKPDTDTELSYLKKPKTKSLIYIKEIPIEIKPCHIYQFSKNNSEEIGGIWFIAKLNGFKKGELGMFADILFRYLDKHYSNDFYINTDYCIAVDLFNGYRINYSEIKNGNIPILIDSTIDDLKKIK